MKGNFRYSIELPDGKILFSDLNEVDVESLQNLKTSGKSVKLENCRVGKFKSRHAEVKIVSEDRNHINSSRQFSKLGDCILDSSQIIQTTVTRLEENQHKNIQRVVHNLLSLNAHNIQEIYAFIPQDENKEMSKRFKSAEAIVRANPKSAAKTLVRIARNNSAMKVELSVFSRLLGENPVLKPSIHKVHKVLMNIFYVFFPDFTDKYVKVNIEHCTKSAFVDYESLHVALFHLIENLSKYVKEGSDINVSFHESNHLINVEIKMFSLALKEGEEHRIFVEGFSGHHAKKANLNGKGIGMNRALKLVELNNASIEFLVDHESTQQIDGRPYQHQSIKLGLPKKKQSR
ncbi:MAG: hypothetical protein AAF546_11030 [Verrucomicrobiota bacterium]